MIDGFHIKSIPFSRLTSEELLLEINHAVDSNRQLLLSVLDASMVVNMKLNRHSREAILASNLIVADGYYVALALRLLGRGPVEQITGFDTMLNVMRLAQDKGYKIFFLGAEESVIQGVARHVDKRYGPSVIAGFRNGYFDVTDTRSIVEEINVTGADILFVGISSPIRELFLHQSRKHLKVPFLMGVGGVFDILGGKTRRAPRLIIKLRIEWLYRFVLEPRRMWRRVFYTCPYFVYCFLAEWFDDFSSRCFGRGE